jgi:hypothetical protein
MLDELYNARAKGTGWVAGTGAVFNLRGDALRPEGFTSADAAGLPICPLLVRYPRGQGGRSITRGASPFRAPSAATSILRHTSPRAARMRIYRRWGVRLRLAASYSLQWFSGQALVILEALKRYGLIVADKGSP